MGDTTGGPPCDGDGDCLKFTNACNDAACIDRACVVEAKVCNDSSVCTDDRCDAERGCVFDAREAGTACQAGPSEACDGSSWHLRDVCDEAGRCVDGGVQSCLAVGGFAVCRHVECVAGAGCQQVSDLDGTSCVADGRSDVCVDARYHGADRCQGGVCVDAGDSRCPTGWCAVAVCDGRECAADPIGVDVDMTGKWALFELYENDAAETVAARTNLVLAADGSIAVESRLGPSGEPVPEVGVFCVASDHVVNLALGRGDDERGFRGRLTRGRELAFLHHVGRDGVAMLVRMHDNATAKRLDGRYRLLGYDYLQMGSVRSIDAMLGEVRFSQLCFDNGNYTLGGTEVAYLMRPQDAGDCLELKAGDSSVAFFARTQGDARVWGGFVGANGDYAVLQRIEPKENPIAPSLVLLVHEGLATPFAFSGDYATLRLDVAGGPATLSEGALAVTGISAIASFSEGDVVLGNGDSGTVFIDTQPNPLVGGLFMTLTIGGQVSKRAGQIGPTTSSRADWFVDVSASPNDDGNFPVAYGQSLRFGVRKP